MSKQISFIHAADLHLDSPFKGLAHIPESIFKDIRESTFIALDQLILTAIQKKVDFVLITGDLFDNEKQSLKAQVHLRKAFETLDKHNILVYISYGNHDHLKGNIYPVTYPDNVHIFSSEVVSHFIYVQEGQPVAEIHGFSYENRAVLTNKVSEYQIENTSVPYHIAMLHGSVETNTAHDMYAPFQMKDLLEKDFDYWALGHIHQREILKEDPFVVYPGNTQGRNRKEVNEKGCYHVILSEAKRELTFVPLQALQFINIKIDVSDCADIHALEILVRKEIKDIYKSTTPQLIDLALVSDNKELSKWKSDRYLEDIIEIINETIIHEQNWNYIFRFSIDTYYTTLDNDLYVGDHFIGELTKQFEEISIQPFIKDLFNHRQARKYLQSTVDVEEAAIKAEAKQLLINELMNNGGG